MKKSRVSPEREGVPIVRFKRGERKDDIAKKYLTKFRGREGVLFIGVAQEPDKAFRSAPHHRKDGRPSWTFYRASVAVDHYYFYVLDRNWGPGFIKFSSYAPFGVRVCINGHEWAKRQLEHKGIAFEALDNGFLSCAQPERLQAICDSLGPDDVERFFRTWLSRLPHPFTRKDRAAGYRYRLSIWQFEFSLTQVFDRPLHGRQFFEEILRENLDLGRPDRIQLLFARSIRRAGKHPTPSSFRTRVVQHDTLPKLSVEYKHSRVKQYFKEGRALRTETVINNPLVLIALVSVLAGLHGRHARSRHALLIGRRRRSEIGGELLVARNLRHGDRTSGRFATRTARAVTARGRRELGCANGSEIPGLHSMAPVLEARAA